MNDKVEETMPKSLREIITTLLISASGEYVVANLTRPQGSDTSDITKKLTKSALKDIADWLESKKVGIEEGFKKELTGEQQVGWNACIDELKKECI